MQSWSEAQVQQWFTLIGLPQKHVEIVQLALSEDATDGEDLEDLKKKRLQLQHGGGEASANGQGLQQRLLHGASATFDVWSFGECMLAQLSRFASHAKRAGAHRSQASCSSSSSPA